MAFSPDSGTLAVGMGGPARVILWDVASGTTRANLVCLKAEGIGDIEFSADGRFLVAGLYWCDDPVGLWKIVDEPQGSGKPQIDTHGQ
jgi:WD40 repeat protein